MEKTFDIKLTILKGMMNEEAIEWLEDQMENKIKWALAFDDGSRYGVCNTNISEVLNKVLKGIVLCPFQPLWSTHSTRSIHTLCIDTRKQGSK